MLFVLEVASQGFLHAESDAGIIKETAQGREHNDEASQKTLRTTREAERMNRSSFGCLEVCVGSTRRGPDCGGARPLGRFRCGKGGALSVLFIRQEA